MVLSSSHAQEVNLELYYSGRYDQVITQSAESIANGDTAFNSYYLKALSEVQLGRTQDAISTLRQAQGIHPQEPRIERLLASQLYDAGLYTEAHSYYTVFVERDSTDLAAWMKLAEIALFGQHYEEADASLIRVIELDTANLAALIMLGDLLNRQNNTGAVIYYEKAWRLYPGNQKVAYTLGNWYIQANRPGETVPLCEKVLFIDSTQFKFEKLLGFAHYKMGEPRIAILHFEKALALGDSSAFTYKFLGISHYMVVALEDAIISLQKGVEKDSMDAEVHFFLGASLGTTTQKKRAMYHLDRSLELMKPDPSVISRIYTEQGNIMRLEAEYEIAYSFFEKAWEADGSNPLSLYYMASILDNSMHRSSEALVDYQRFIDQLNLHPESEMKNGQIPTIRNIVEDRIELLKEELFFLDEQ